MYKISERLRQITKPLFAEVLTDGAIVVYAFAKSQRMAPAVTSSSLFDLTPSFNGIAMPHGSLRIYALKRATNEIVELKKTGPVLFFQVNSTTIKKIKTICLMIFPNWSRRLLSNLQ